MTYIDTRKERPISPHLSIYKPQISSTLSILHRISGVINYIGLSILLWWITWIAFSTSDIYTHCFWTFFASTPGKFVLFVFSLSMAFHFFAGIRHLGWDAGLGFDLKTMCKTGWLVVVASLLSVGLFWILIS